MRIIYHHRTQGEEPESIHIHAIVHALRELGHEVRIVGPAPLTHRADGAQKPTLLGRMKRLVPRPMFEVMQLFYNLVAYWKLRGEIRKFSPDLIYERYALFAFAGVLCARFKGGPFILEVNTPYAQAWTQYFGLYFGRIARNIEGHVLRASDHLTTVTQVQREMLVQLGVPRERISVCHNAIDPDWFNAERHGDPGLRDRLGLRGVVVGFVGTMNRWQGILEFPGVLKSVLSRSNEVTFLFVGDGEFRGALEQFCRTNSFADRAIFTGRKPHAEIPALVAAMDIAVMLNSNSYGSPMKLFEYLGMAKAVIAPSVGPVVEVLRDGETGLLIEPGNGSQMAEQILRLANDAQLRQRLGENGRTYVLAHHTWRTNAEAALAAYDQLVARAKSNV